MKIDTRTSFIDMLLSGQMNLFVIFVMALLLISPHKKEEGNVRSKAEMMLTVSWGDGVDCDVDTWVKSSEAVVYWKNRDGGSMHLERDDTGNSNDPTSTLNEENWAMRGIVPGEYVVNLHLYRTKVACGDVRVVLRKVNPFVQIVADKKVSLLRQDQEEHVFRFNVDANGNVTRVWDEPAVIAHEYLTQSPAVSIPGP